MKNDSNVMLLIWKSLSMWSGETMKRHQAGARLCARTFLLRSTASNERSIFTDLAFCCTLKSLDASLRD